MGTTTGIEWTDATWNPILGCSRVSEGCRNCYAEGIAARFGGGKETVYSGLTRIVNGRPVWTGKIVETRQLLLPLRWRTPKRVFVNSMSDLFHENVTDEQRDKIFAVMALCPQHTFQVLTKRPSRMRAYLDDDDCHYRIGIYALSLLDGWLPGKPSTHNLRAGLWPLPNIWLGVSVENQAAAEERIPLLLQAPAAVRFLSCEPLLGPLNLERAIVEHQGEGDEAEVWRKSALDDSDVWRSDDGLISDGPQYPKVDWVICGGESGPHARPMQAEWARKLRDQCVRAEVPFFFKQWGEWAPLGSADEADNFDRRVPMTEDHSHVRIGKKAAGALLDSVEWHQFPESVCS